MGWIIAALLTSIVILGGTWYYIEHDDMQKKQKSIQSNAFADNFADSKPGKVSLKDIWDIEDIRDSVIFLRNNRYSAVIGVGAIDFRMMSDDEQAAVENALIQAALSLSFDVQLYASSEYIDVEAAIQSIATGSASGLPGLMTYAEQAINYLSDMMKSKSVYVRRNYIIVSYDGPVEKAYEELNRRCNIVIAGLQRARVPAHRLSSSEILDLVHARLNRGSSAKPSAVAANGGFELYVTGMQERS